MNKGWRALSLIACSAVVTLATKSTAQDKPEFSHDAGFVTKMDGKCWRQRGAAKPDTLYNGAGLRIGDKVRCDQHGLLIVELRSLRTTIEPSPADRWTTIPSASGRRQDAMAGPIDDWFQLAGGPRKVPAGVYSPPSGGYRGAVWPDHFVIRWVPRNRVRSLSFTIRDELGTPLWPADGEPPVTVPSAQGELAAQEAREGLLRYRRTGGRGPLSLIAIDSEGNEDRVQFSVISDRDEATLETHLNTCASQPGITQYICRAYYFRQLGLYVEAAAEYDAALANVAPESTDLRVRAIVAHRFTGNYRREQDLTRQLPPGTQPPGP